MSNPFVGFDVFVKQDESIATLIADANEMGEAFREGSISEEEYRVGSQHLRKRFAALNVAHINATGYTIPNEEYFSVEDSLNVPWKRYGAGNEEYEPPSPDETPRTPSKGDRSGLAGLGPNYPDTQAEIPVQNNQIETEGKIDKMSNPFVGFDIFAKQSDPDDSDDPDNPTAESLGLTGNRVRTGVYPSTPYDTDMGHTVPDPAAQMGQLPVRPERIATMEQRKKEGKEAHPGFAQERAKALQSVPTTHRDNEWMASVLADTLGISIMEAVDKIAKYREGQAEWSPYTEMSEKEAEENLEAEAGNAFSPEGGFEYSKSVDGFVKALGFFIDSYGGEK